MSAEDEIELEERLDINNSITTITDFCKDYGYDINDIEVWSDILSVVYRNGYKWGMRDASDE